MSTRWDDAILNQYRQIGDKEADLLVDQTFQGKNGSIKSNRMLLLANQLIEQPGLFFVDDSWVAKELNSYRKDDPGLADYYEPMEAPDWVDMGKLKLASKFWHENTIVSLGVLYAASLPSCYLIEKGIPALYKTGKLLPPYLNQRIYETGLMLDAVMDEDGINIIEDKEFDMDYVLADEVARCIPGSHVQRSRHHLHIDRGESKGSVSDGPGLEDLVNTVNQAVTRRLKEGTKRYLWGKGYITAKKVRFLHASMRYMLLNPSAVSPPPTSEDGQPKPFMEKIAERQEAWDSQTLGAPVNQEDVAYTLLTFGLIIPKGLEKWGIPISQEEKDAFLHLWKLIGHVMGIEDGVLTDQWDEAEALFALVQQRQCGGSPDGVALTEALIGMMDDYLPKLPGVKLNSMPVELIVSQMGEKFGKDLISPETWKSSRPCLLRPAYAFLGGVAKLYFGLRTAYLKSFPLLGDISANLVHEVGEAIIDSWRDAYRRVPFFVPNSLTDWQRLAGADPEYLKVLKDWRQGMLITAGFSLVLLVISVFGLTVAFPLWLLQGQTAFFVSLGITAGSYVLFATIAKKKLTKLLENRPKPNNRIIKLAKHMK